ncbi:MAG: FMN-binding protein [Spirochaetales bacterium]|nr:FMN-binding protein [Spirochaetales bacterium]
MKKVVLMLLFILIMGGILSSAIISVNYFTAPIIKANEEKKLKTNILMALEIPFTEDDMDSVFQQKVTVRRDSGNEMDYYVSENNETAFEYKGKGLWGPIRGVIALNPDFKTIKNVTISFQEETPGLGSRIAEKPYLDQFRNKAFSPSIVITRSPAKKDNEVDAITGATLSSKAFVKILNGELGPKIEKITGGN